MRKYVPTIGRLIAISVLIAIFVFALMTFLTPAQSNYSASLNIKFHNEFWHDWKLYIDNKWVLNGTADIDENFSITYNYVWSGEQSKVISVMLKCGDFSVDTKGVSIVPGGSYEVTLFPETELA